jgi:serine protease Do
MAQVECRPRIQFTRLMIRFNPHTSIIAYAENAKMNHIKRIIFKTPLLFFFMCLLLVYAKDAWSLTGKAQQIYENNSHAVFQIRVIDIKSQSKSVIGSGFRISNDGLLATNFHVISDVVDKPEQYRIEYFSGEQKEGDLVIQSIDVANDLAILKGGETGKISLRFGSSQLHQGAVVYPMGNPLDIGMVIVEGTYNGLIGGDPYKQIILSAPLNPGMSGGPAFDSKGNIIGVNVAIRGNNLSYLVPIEYLLKLKDNLEKSGPQEDWTEIIQDQVLKRYSYWVDKALDSDWSFENFGSLKIPQKLMDTETKCWGQSRTEDPKENKFFFYGTKRCESYRNIYLTSKLSTGFMGYAFSWMESESLNPLELYRKYSQKYSSGKLFLNLSENDVTEFQCQNHFVRFADHDWKAAYCVRRYKEYPKLYDLFLSFAVLVDSPRKYILQMGLSGLDEPMSKRLLQKFLGSIQWNE